MALDSVASVVLQGDRPPGLLPESTAHAPPRALDPRPPGLGLQRTHTRRAQRKAKHAYMAKCIAELQAQQQRWLHGQGFVERNTFLDEDIPTPVVARSLSAPPPCSSSDEDEDDDHQELHLHRDRHWLAGPRLVRASPVRVPLIALFQAVDYAHHHAKLFAGPVAFGRRSEFIVHARDFGDYTGWPEPWPRD